MLHTHKQLKTFRRLSAVVFCRLDNRPTGRTLLNSFRAERVLSENIYRRKVHDLSILLLLDILGGVFGKIIVIAFGSGCHALSLVKCTTHHLYKRVDCDNVLSSRRLVLMRYSV
jgi:hypothetical protein